VTSQYCKFKVRNVVFFQNFKSTFQQLYGIYVKIGGDKEGDVGWPRDCVELIPPATDDRRHEETKHEADWYHSGELVTVVGDHLKRPAASYNNNNIIIINYITITVIIIISDPRRHDVEIHASAAKVHSVYR